MGTADGSLCPNSLFGGGPNSKQHPAVPSPERGGSKRSLPQVDTPKSRISRQNPIREEIGYYNDQFSSGESEGSGEETAVCVAAVWLESNESGDDLVASVPQLTNPTSNNWYTDSESEDIDTTMSDAPRIRTSSALNIDAPVAKNRPEGPYTMRIDPKGLPMSPPPNVRDTGRERNARYELCQQFECNTKD